LKKLKWNILLKTQLKEYQLQSKTNEEEKQELTKKESYPNT